VTRLILIGFIRSQRVVGVILLTLAVIAAVASNRPQAPGSALAAVSLLMVPAHAWAAMTIATGTDIPTREAFVAAIGVGRVLAGHILAALVIGAVADLAVVAVALVARTMSPRPAPAQWIAAALVGGAGLVLGSAIGTVAGPPVVQRRGARVLVLVWLMVVGPLILPVLRLARVLTDARPSEVVGAVTGPVVLTAGAAAVLMAGGMLVAARRQ